MTKEDAYKELCKEFDKGKREWSFEEMAEVLEKTMNVPKSKTHQILHNLAKEQSHSKTTPSKKG